MGADGIGIKRIGLEERLVDWHLLDFAGGIAAEGAQLAHHIFDVVAASLIDGTAFGIETHDSLQLMVVEELVLGQ